ncbi:hypothetical protein [Haloferula sp. BvORR071]|uniref:hypothetical protein n=1 Tax=Haloferula sp. BvORR071 TaxID=1396141 RepID=UPI000695B658|nr:hypothetical protein [Haloferula sp. BvORR071]
MKSNISLLFAVLGLAFSPALRAADEHEHKDGDKKEAHEHGKKQPGPNGGRIVTSTEPHFEFFVMPDGKVKITFLGEDGKATALKEQSVTLTGGDRAKPTKLAFAKDGDSLVSDKALPEGKEVPVVLQVKVTPDAKTVSEKFNVNLADCPTCKFKEYACICEHGGDDHEGHDHKH